MKITKKNQHFTVEIEMSEAEIQSLIGLFEELSYWKQVPFEEIMGLRKEIYDKLVAILKN